ncbi:hypothetical protein [Psychroflexus aestuariivivens]|uniref:hypothetical protein n=1 Tax=Psychroflexus aestuariivivens TaxID=1795040 RepID=UPI000FDBAEC0|nr:hypothetical protein [Psychroflexus aestuariivivens]
MAFVFGLLIGYGFVSLIFWEFELDLLIILILTSIIMFLVSLGKIKRDLKSIELSILDEKVHFSSRNQNHVFKNREDILVKDKKNVLVLEDKNVSNFNRKMWGTGVVNIPKEIQNYEALKTYLRI